MERCTAHITNTYYIPHVRVSGYSCATNLSSNTAFRGFGAPQAMFFMESIIDHVSRELKIDSNVVRERNFFANGQTTIYNQLITNFTAKTCWDEVLEKSEYTKMYNEITQFNRYMYTKFTYIYFNMDWSFHWAKLINIFMG